MVEATLVTVHGFWSAPSTWDRLRAVWQADKELEGLQIHGFGYSSPKKPRLPLSWTRVPSFDDIAQTLATEYTTVLAKTSNVVFVTHSQGGLVLQRFLAWMSSQGRARELTRIRVVVTLACPTGGSQYFTSVRHVLGYSRHPQAAELETLSKQVADTQRTVLKQIVHATMIDDYQCHIPFYAYAGASDGIVPTVSAQATFPEAGALAGNHFTILDPMAPGNRTAEIVKHHILRHLDERPTPSPLIPALGPATPGKPVDHGMPEVNLADARGVQIGENNVQSNFFCTISYGARKDPSTAAANEAKNSSGVTNEVNGTVYGSVIQAGTISGSVTINDPNAANRELPQPDQG